MKKFGLGKGLGSLIPTKNQAEEMISEKSPVADGLEDKIFAIDINLVEPNPEQPRKQFLEAPLEELAESIRRHGIIQPLIAVKTGENYQLIAGERRLRAAKMAGLKTVPVVVRDAQRQEQLELSLLENIQRHDLNPIEEAIAYKRLIEEFNLTQEELSTRVGKSRPVITNMLRILQLGPEIQKALMEGKITYSTARIIVGLPPDEQLNFFYKVLKHGYNVSDTAFEAKKIYTPKYAARTVDPVIAHKEEALQQHLKTRVAIQKNGHRGHINIYFYSEEELESIVKKIVGD